MRIGLLCHSGFGGSTRVALDLAGAFARRGHDVHLFARRPPLGLVRLGDGVTLHACRPTAVAPTPHLETRWPREDLERFIRHVARASDALGLDVLHFHYAVPFAEIAVELRRLAGRSSPKLVGTLHGTDVTTSRRGLGSVLAQLDAVTTVSRTYAELARALLHLEKRPVVIPNFVDTALFRPAARFACRRVPRVVHVSNFRPVKEPAMVARVFAEVVRRVDAELWLVGDGEEMPAVRATIARAGLAARVRWLGLTRDVASIVPRTDVLLLTSRSESFSLAALEASACGVPVVAPAVGGLPEVVLDGVTGLLFEPGDEAGAADAVTMLLHDDGVRRSMGRAAVARARSFSRDDVVAGYETLYRGLLRAAAPACAGRPA